MSGKEGAGKVPTFPRKGAFREKMTLPSKSKSETTTTCYIKLMQLLQGSERASVPQFISHLPGAVIRVLSTPQMCEGNEFLLPAVGNWRALTEAEEGKGSQDSFRDKFAVRTGVRALLRGLNGGPSTDG